MRGAEQSEFADHELARLLFDSQPKQRKIDAARTTLQKGLAKNPTSSDLLEASLQLEIELGAALPNGE